MRTDAPYEELRPLLFSIAYRMVSSVSEAEDIVQEAFLRIHRAEAEGTKVDAPKAYLSAVVTRLSIDHLKSARARREQYVGQWLPEPLLTDSARDAAAQAETADSLSMAFLVLLESLTPVERAVFLLREVFDYDYAEIAKIVQRSEENCRQLYVRARTHIDGQPGVMFLDEEGRIGAVMSIEIADGVIQTIRGITNPDKLAHLGTVADLRAILRRGRTADRSGEAAPLIDNH